MIRRFSEKKSSQTHQQKEFQKSNPFTGEERNRISIVLKGIVKY